MPKKEIIRRREHCVLNVRQFDEFKTKYQRPGEPTCGPHTILNAYRIGLLSLLDINDNGLNEEQAKDYERVLRKAGLKCRGSTLDDLLCFVKTFNEKYDAYFHDMFKIRVSRTRPCRNIDIFHSSIERHIKSSEEYETNLVSIRDKYHWYLVIGTGVSLDKGKYFVVIDSGNNQRIIYISELEEFPVGMDNGRLNLVVGINPNF